MPTSWRRESKGDRADLSLDAEDLATIAQAKKAEGPVVLVLISGRPVVLGEALARADALVAAWLSGTQGLSVADVLFSDHPPTRKLPVSWPRSVSQIPINVGDPGYATCCSPTGSAWAISGRQGRSP